MKRFSLASLLLLIAFVGASLAWWLERTKNPDVLYLHIFSWHFRVTHDPAHPNPSRTWPAVGQQPTGVRVGPDLNPVPVCLATVTINPDVPIWAALPNRYDPTIYVDGKLKLRDRNHLEGRLEVQLHAPDVATAWNNGTTIQLDELVPDVDAEHFYVISRSREPYDLDAIVKQPWNKVQNR